MKTLIAVAAMTFMCIAHASDDCPLKGKWLRDNEKSMANAHKDAHASPKVAKVIQKLLSTKFEAEFTCDQLIMQFDGTKIVQPYRTVSIWRDQGKLSSVTIEIYGDKKLEYSEFTLSGNCYEHLVERKLWKPFNEVFCRVK